MFLILESRFGMGRRYPPVRMSAWVPYRGVNEPRKGERIGWKHTVTGEVRYVEDMPGDDEPQSNPVRFSGHIYDAGDADSFKYNGYDDLWLYHVTTKDRADRILKAGFNSSDSMWFTKSEHVPKWVKSAREESDKPLAVVKIPAAFISAMKHLDFKLQDKYSATHQFDPNAAVALSSSELGYLWHEAGPVLEWAKKLPYDVSMRAVGYAGFGYNDANKMLRGLYQPRRIKVFVRDQTPEEIAMPQYHDYFHDKTKYNPDVDGGEEHRVQDHTFKIDGVVHPHAIMKVVDDDVATDQVKKTIEDLNDAIREYGYVLPSEMEVFRGAYIPGLTPEYFQKLIDDGEIFTEKAFASTMVGEAGGRRDGYAVAAKWESIYTRYPNKKIAENQDEVGIAVTFQIYLPEGTKVLSVEAIRRMDWKHPIDAEGNLDFEKTPIANDRRLSQKSSRSESEVLLGSGAQFRVRHIVKSRVIESGDKSLKPVQVYLVVMDYVGGGSSQWDS